MFLGSISPTDRLADIASDNNFNLENIMDNDLNIFAGQCPYIDPDEIHTLEIGHNRLNILQLNIHSLNDKLNDLTQLIAKCKTNGCDIDIIMICETFINDQNVDLCKIPGFSLIEKHRHLVSRGGVGIFISDQLSYVDRPDLAIFKERKFESCFIELPLRGSKNIIVGEIYRIPGTNEHDFLIDYQNIIRQIQTENKLLILGMDQNIDYIKINTNHNAANFLDINLTSGLIPTIIRPTRITHTTATLIDNIYICNEIASDFKSAILTTHISDHLPCLLSLSHPTRTKNHNTTVIKTRDLNDANLESINRLLYDTTWACLDNMTVDDSYNYVVRTINNCIDLVAPERTKTITNKRIPKEPWMTSGLLKSSSKCDKLYRKVIGRDKNDKKYLDYIKYRNTYNSIKRKAKHSYFSNKIIQFKNSSKQLWGTLKYIIGKANNKESITDTFLINGQEVTDAQKISNAFGKFFSTIGQSLASKIGKPKNDYKFYMPDPVNNSFFFFPTDPSEINKLILSLKPKTSTGHDNLNNKLLKALGGSILAPLSIIFNKSLAEGHYPDEMKISKIIPIFKNKEKRELTNYRPIALLPVISKLLEKIVHKRLYKFLIKNNTLYISQYGFRHGYSTTLAISELVGNIIKGFESKYYTLGSFIDLSKAFDSLDLTQLVDKLKTYGIRGAALNWFQSYLSNRRLFVKFKEANSDTFNVDYGIPQGSVLGPLLFLLYTNDMHRCIKHSKCILFADDTTIYTTGSSVVQLVDNMTRDLDSLIDWFRANKLTLNISKTACILFRPNKNMGANSNNVKIKIGNEEIKLREHCKFLGLDINEYLDWTLHVNSVCCKISRHIYLLNCIKNIVPIREKNYFTIAISTVT